MTEELSLVSFAVQLGFIGGDDRETLCCVDSNRIAPVRVFVTVRFEIDFGEDARDIRSESNLCP